MYRLYLLYILIGFILITYEEVSILIEVSHLTKKYGSHVAVNDISFTVRQGEILGFLGPNGAGKSTTMNMLTGYLASTSGSIQINGIDILENPVEAKKKIGYLPELPPLYLDMTVKDYLTFVCKLKQVPKEIIKEHLQEIMKLARIDDVSHRIIKNLSKGYKQRTGLASALVGNPDVLILDEPSVGLDPKQIIEIRNLVKDLSKKHTIILSSHILSEVSAVCDRVMIISKGNIVASDTPNNLSKLRHQSSELKIRVRNFKKSLIEELKKLEGIMEVTVESSEEENTMDLTLTSNPSIDSREAIFNLCYEQKMPILLMQPHNVSLEDIFLQVTQVEDPKVSAIENNTTTDVKDGE
jgi:ABC-2 type transport system ATP-binding protein